MAVRTEDRDPTGSQPPRATRGGRDLADRAGWSQTIVVPLPPASIDPAHVGEAVIPVARAIAGRTGANVTLLTVVDETSPFNPLTQMVTRVSAAGEAPGVNEAQEQLARLATAFSSGHVDTVVRSGHAAEEILSVIRESDQPLLMLCSHTRTGLEHCLYGSVAGELVRAAPCPVLVVRGSQAALAEGETPLETVIAPLDQSPFAERALDAALAALGPAGYHVHLLHVIDPSSYPDLAPADLATLVEPKLTRYLHEVALPLLGKGYRVSTEVRYGQPADEIAQAATDQDADVIAMGTHGRGGFHPILLGSVAERLLAAAPVPLLFARPAASARAPGQPAEATPAGADQTEPRATSPALIERRARELMTQPVVVARAETPLEEVATAMVQNRIGCVPIVDERGQLAGIITESDFLRADPGLPLAAYQISPLLHERVPAEAIEQMYRAGRELTAAQIMTHPVTTVTEDTPLGEVAALLLQGRINQVPVERDGAPVGIVARRDLLHLLLPAGDYPAGGAGGE